jgi:hypothetical protein
MRIGVWNNAFEHGDRIILNFSACRNAQVSSINRVSTEGVQ